MRKEKVSNNIKLQYLVNIHDASVCDTQIFLANKFSKTHRKIIVVHRDHLGGDSLFLPSLQRELSWLDKIISMASLYPEFEFTVIHSCLNICTKFKPTSFERSTVGSKCMETMPIQDAQKC